MPLPEDERVVALANDILQQFDRIFGLHPGFRPVHAKGVMLTGTFKPTAAGKELTKVPYTKRESTPVTVRFSDSTGIPAIPDSSPDANPRGMAIRFNFAEHVHTDIIGHSTNGFPARDGKEFLGLLEAIAGSGPDVPSPKPVEIFVGSHPAALAYVQAPKPFSIEPGAAELFSRNSVCFYE
jgi:catalase